jgi:hypothetical protein
MALGAWQDMFKVINLEDRPINDQHNQQVLYNDGTNEIVMTEVVYICSSLTLDSNVLCGRDNMAFRVSESGNVWWG